MGGGEKGGGRRLKQPTVQTIAPLFRSTTLKACTSDESVNWQDTIGVVSVVGLFLLLSERYEKVFLLEPEQTS